jgi:hypothetical protein
MSFQKFHFHVWNTHIYIYVCSRITVYVLRTFLSKRIAGLPEDMRDIRKGLVISNKNSFYNDVFIFQIIFSKYFK